MNFPRFLSARWLILPVLLLAFYLRLRTLAAAPLWFDEAMEFWVATAALADLPAAVREALQDPPLYTVLLHFWMGLGRDEFTLRLLSTCASLLALPAAAALGREVYSRPAGLIAAFFLALLPPDIRFAQEVGQYALLSLTLSANLLLLALARRTDRRRHWTGWAVTAAAAAFNYYGSLLIILPAAGVLALERLIRRRWGSLFRLGTAALGFALLAGPLLAGWLPDQLFRGPTSGAFAVSFGSPGQEWALFLDRTRYLLSYQFTGFIADPTPHAALILAGWGLLLAALLAGAAGLVLERRPLFFLGWLLAGWAVYYLAGRVDAYPYGMTRHALILTPLLITVAGIGAAALGRRWRPAGCLLIAAFVAIVLAAPGEGPEDLRTVTDDFLDAHRPDTPVYVYYGAAPGFRYQLLLRGQDEGRYPATWYRDCWGGSPAAYCAPHPYYYGAWIRALPPGAKREAIAAAVDPEAAAFWVIFSHTGEEEQAALLAALDEAYRREASIEAEGAGAYLWRTR